MPTPSTTEEQQFDLLRQMRKYQEYMTEKEVEELQNLLIVPSKEIERYRIDPVAFAREVLKFDVNHYQERILNALVTHRRVCVRGPHGMGKCLSATEKIRLADGSLVPAWSLIDTKFEVLSVDDKLQVHRATAFAKDNGVKDVIEITTDRGRIIQRTFEHPLWSDIDPYHYNSKEGRDRINPQGSWNEIQHLKIGSTVAVYLGNDGAEGVDVPDEAIKLLGYFIADGGLTNGMPTFSQVDGVILDEFISCCEAFGCRVIHSGGYNYRVSFNTDGKKKLNPITEILRLWELMGKNSYEKYFPDWVWNLDNRQLSLLVSRLFSCDGWASLSSIQSKSQRILEIGYSTVSKKLAEDVLRALLRLGIQGNIRSRIATSQNGTSCIAYTVGIHNIEDIKPFCETIGIYGKEDAVENVYQYAKNASIDKIQRWRGLNLPSNMRWEKIYSIRVIENQPTVSITVPEYETFITDFVEHNSAILSIIILWFITVHEECKIPTTASVWRQLTEFLWPEIHKWATRKECEWWRVGLKIREGKELLGTKLTLGSNRFAFAISSTDEAKIEGAHSEAILYVFDESKTIPAAIWDAAEGALTTPNSYAISCSTPGDSVGRFYDIQSFKPEYKDWHVIHVTLEDAILAGRIERAWAELRKNQWGEKSVMYRRRVLGEFAEDDNDTVITLSMVEAAQERWKKLKLDEQALVASGVPATKAFETIWGKLSKIGCDPAGSGGDKIAFAYRHSGDKIYSVERIMNKDTMQIAGKLRPHLEQDFAVIAFIDVNGIGAGTYDRLHEDELNVVPVQVSNKTDLTDVTGFRHFFQYRDWLWWNMRDLLEAEDSEVALPPDDELAYDLVCAKYSNMSNGKIKVSSKKEMRQVINRSPDVGESVIFTFASEKPPRKVLMGFF